MRLFVGFLSIISESDIGNFLGYGGEDICQKSDIHFAKDLE